MADIGQKPIVHLLVASLVVVVITIFSRNTQHDCTSVLNAQNLHTGGRNLLFF